MRQPLDIGFELSNLCNLHCIHCIRGSVQARVDRLDLSLFRRTLDEACTLFDPVAVVFTGGEPLASELFPTAVREVVSRGMTYRFVTNGWLIPRHLPLLVRHPPQFARVSLSGASEETHDSARGEGSFRRALLAVAVLATRGIRAELSMVVTRASRRELVAAADLAASLGAAELHFILPQPTPESATHGLDLAPNEWDEVADEVRALARTSRAIIGLDYGTRLAMPRPSCRTMAMRQIYVDANGQVPYCCQLSRYGSGADPIIGDLRVESLAAIVERARRTYVDAELVALERHRRAETDALDAYPCLSCARGHGKLEFLAEYPEHPWSAIAVAVAGVA